MQNEDKLVDAIIDLHKELSLFRKENNERLERVEKQQIISNSRLEKVEAQLASNNKATGELRLGVMRLADQSQKHSDYERRIRKIETILIKKNFL